MSTVLDQTGDPADCIGWSVYLLDCIFCQRFPFGRLAAGRFFVTGRAAGFGCAAVGCAAVGCAAAAGCVVGGKPAAVGCPAGMEPTELSALTAGGILSRSRLKPASTLSPDTTGAGSGGGGIAPKMSHAFQASMLTFFLLYALLLVLRTRLAIMEDEAEELRADAGGFRTG